MNEPEVSQFRVLKLRVEYMWCYVRIDEDPKETKRDPPI